MCRVCGWWGEHCPGGKEDLTAISISITNMQHPGTSLTSVILISKLWGGRVGGHTAGGGGMEAYRCCSFLLMGCYFSPGGRTKARPQSCQTLQVEGIKQNSLCESRRQRSREWVTGLQPLNNPPDLSLQRKFSKFQIYIRTPWHILYIYVILIYFKQNLC